VGGGFSPAQVHQVDTGTAKFCLRAWPRSGPPRARLLELHRWLAFLHGRGITEVAVPLPAADGSTLTEHDSRLWQLEPWMPGQSDFRLHPNGERLRNAMHALARLHMAAAEYAAAEPGREWFYQTWDQPSPAVRERLDLLRSWTDNRIRSVRAAPRPHPETGIVVLPLEDTAEVLQHFTWVAPTIARELASMAVERFRLHPCLRDVWHDHILFTGKHVTGIIDPAAARSENVASDLARLLGDFAGDDAGRWKFALDAYAEVRPLTDSEHRLVHVLDRSAVVLSALGWAERRIEITQPYFRTDDVLRRADQFVARLRVLADSIRRH
jgi:Ser/Thr protein kinase RdoA (MazF antagonist)